MSEDKMVHIQSQVPALVSDNAFAVDFTELKKITPYTLSIDQPMSEKEGVQAGMLRVNETGQLRKEVKIVLIQKPRESRAFEIGEFPNKKTMCFSRDMVSPDKRSQDMQAMVCSGCKHASWDKYNKTKNIADAPGCKITSQVVFIDYDNVYPVQMFVRGKSRSQGLEEGLKQVTQQFVMLQMKNGSVAWTDVIMTLTTEKIKGNPNYMLKIKNVRPPNDEEREHLSGIIGLIAAQRAAFNQKLADAAEKAEQQATDDEVTKAAQPVEGEYVQGNSEEI